MKNKFISFLGGVEVKDEAEAILAYKIGYLIGKLGFVLKHGGYGGIMEQAAKGCKDAGGHVIAVNLANTDWGALNNYVDEELVAATLQDRLDIYLDAAIIIVADGGIGTLFEASYFIHHFINNKEHTKPIIFAGKYPSDLLDYLKDKRWLVQSNVRDISYIKKAGSLDEIECILNKYK